MLLVKVINIFTSIFSLDSSLLLFENECVSSQTTIYVIFIAKKSGNVFDKIFIKIMLHSIFN